MQKYRELEQARFLSAYHSRIHPDLLDPFLAVVDAIFDVRAPPLLTVLSRYQDFDTGAVEETSRKQVISGLNEREEELKRRQAMSDAEIDDEGEEDDDDEDFMDEPSVDFESKSMKDMTLEDIDQITFVDMEGNEVSLKLDDLGLNDPDDISGLQD